MSELTRRRVLALTGSAATAGLLAGCNSFVDSSAGSGGGTTTAPGTGDGPTAGGQGGPTGTGDPDLPETNVVSVGFTDTGSTVRFDVTLDQDGGDGSANWWQVDRLDGTRIGRHELDTSRSAQPLTSSAEFQVPSDVSCVVVRGHDGARGYGGQAVLVNLTTSRIRMVDQGRERQSFTESDCP